MSNIINSIQISGVTYDIQGSGGGGITIDPTLDSGSTNPVANSAITTALDAKVNVADNVVSTKTIMYAYDKGDTYYKYLYDKGLRINQFFVSYSESWYTTNTNAWSDIRVTNNGSTTSQINLRVNASNYQIASVTSTSGDFTYALEGGKVNVTLPDGYYIYNLSQNSNFQISYAKYTIYGGQSASALENTDNVIQNIYNEVPKRSITGGSISCDSNYLYSSYYDNNGNSNGSNIQFGTSIKGDDNKLDVYFDGQTIHQKILNTGNGNYCSVPNSPAWNYTDDLDEVIIHFNSGYTGSNTSYTIQVQTIAPSNNTQSDSLYYDVANHTLDASSATYVTATTVGDDYTYSIRPKQEYFNYKILRIRERNWCHISGIDNQRKEEYIITGVTTPSYSYQAQEIIDDLYSKVGSGITSGEVQTMIDESVSGKVDSTVYTAYTAATDTALQGKQDTLSAGTGISISGNVISATGTSITVDSALDSTSENPVQNKVIAQVIGNIETLLASI